jgi:very-short-patch-repair endonuclease
MVNPRAEDLRAEVARKWAIHVWDMSRGSISSDPFALNAYLILRCESPAERLLIWSLCELRVPAPRGLEAQYKVTARGNRYRLDFAIPEKKIAIEVDGHEFHSTKEQRAKDAARDRDLQFDGWRIFRFTSDEIYLDPKLMGGELLRICELPGMIG